MLKENIEGYRMLLTNKCELEKWEIIIESEIDRKLYELLFGEPIKQKKQKKKMSMESLVYIVFGRNAINQLLNEGFKSYNQK